MNTKLMDKLFSEATSSEFKNSVDKKIAEAKERGSASLKTDEDNLQFTDVDGEVVIEDKKNNEKTKVTNPESKDELELEKVSEVKKESDSQPDVIIPVQGGVDGKHEIDTVPEVNIEVMDGISDADKAGVKGKTFSITMRNITPSLIASTIKAFSEAGMEAKIEDKKDYLKEPESEKFSNSQDIPFIVVCTEKAKSAPGWVPNPGKCDYVGNAYPSDVRDDLENECDGWMGSIKSFKTKDEALKFVKEVNSGVKKFSDESQSDDESTKEVEKKSNELVEKANELKKLTDEVVKNPTKDSVEKVKSECDALKAECDAVDSDKIDTSEVKAYCKIYSDLAKSMHFSDESKDKDSDEEVEKKSNELVEKANELKKLTDEMTKNPTKDSVEKVKTECDALKAECDAVDSDKIDASEIKAYCKIYSDLADNMSVKDSTNEFSKDRYVYMMKSPKPGEGGPKHKRILESDKDKIAEAKKDGFDEVFRGTEEQYIHSQEHSSFSDKESDDSPLKYAFFIDSVNKSVIWKVRLDDDEKYRKAKSNSSMKEVFKGTLKEWKEASEKEHDNRKLMNYSESVDHTESMHRTFSATGSLFDNATAPCPAFLAQYEAKDKQFSDEEGNPKSSNPFLTSSFE